MIESRAGRRSMAGSLAIPVLGLAIGAALATGALAGLPLELRVGAAFAIVVLLPGAAIARLIGPPPGGAALAPMWMMGFGVLWNVAIGSGLGVRLLSLPAAERVWMPLTAALWIVAIVADARRRPAEPEPTLDRSRLALVLVLAAAALAFVYTLRLGTPVTYYSDSPDHIGTIRRIIETGNPFPADAFFKDAGALGADPRKGWWHAQVAAIARLAHADAASVWIALSAWIAPLFVLNAAAFGWLTAGTAGAAATAWALFVVWAGNSIWWPMRKAVFATFLTDQLAFAATVALLWDLDRSRRSTRVAAILLALAAVQVHLYAAIQLAIVCGALGVALAIRDRGAGPKVRRLAVTAACMGVACGISLARRVASDVAPHNIIHTEPQGLLYLGDSLRIVSIGVLWDWMGSLWVLFPLSWVALWRRGRDRPATLSILATSLAVALLIFDPLAVAWMQPRLGYLPMRMIWMVPLAGLLGWLAVALGRAAADSARTGSGRALAAAALAALLLWIAPTAREAFAALAAPGAIRAEEHAISPLRWREPLAWMDAHLPPGEVVLSDPVTSYGVPMLTRHYVATLLDQHSSPNDTTALARILDARDALDPYATWDRTREVIRRRGATVVVLNDRFSEIPSFDYWAPGPSWYAAARSRLDREPAAFERVLDDSGFVVYRIHAGALDTVSAAPLARPFVSPWSADRSPVGRLAGPDAAALLRLTLTPRAAWPGDSVTGVAEWRAPVPLTPGSYRVPVRFDRDLPGGFAPPAAVAKPLRKLIERVHHERYRFRADHLPVNGAYGVDLWGRDEVVRDSFAFVVPADAAPGTYRVQIKMFRQPHYPNLHLSDYFLDDDFYSGIPAGEFEVRSGAVRGAGERTHPGEVTR